MLKIKLEVTVLRDTNPLSKTFEGTVVETLQEASGWLTSKAVLSPINIAANILKAAGWSIDLEDPSHLSILEGALKKGTLLAACDLLVKEEWMEDGPDISKGIIELNKAFLAYHDAKLNG